MTQLSLFDTERKVGLLHRWHIRKDGKHIALAAPGASEVHIHPGKYQDVLEYPAFDMTYAEYTAWMKDNQFEEVRK